MLEPVLLQIIIVFGCLTLSINAASFQLTVLHTNDLHSRFDEVTKFGGQCQNNSSKCVGGVARIKYVVDQLKQTEDNIIFLNAGDFFQVLQLSDSNFAQRLRDFRYEITKQNAKFESECCRYLKV